MTIKTIFEHCGKTLEAVGEVEDRKIIDLYINDEHGKRLGYQSVDIRNKARHLIETHINQMRK